MKKSLILTALFLLFASGCALPDPSAEGEAPRCPGTKWTSPRRVPSAPCCKYADPVEYPDPLTLWELVDISLRNNPQTEQSWRNARTAYYNLGSAESTLYPLVDGTISAQATAGNGAGGATTSSFGSSQAGFVSGSRAVGNGNTQSFTTDLAVSYLILDFGGRCAQIRQACKALQAANWTHSRTVQTVMVGTLDAYYNYIYAIGLVHTRELDLHDAEVNLDAAKQRFEAGVATHVDVLQSQASEVNAKLQLVTAQGQVKINRGQLAAAMGWPADTCLVVENLPEHLPVAEISDDICCMVEVAKGSRPDLTAAYYAYLKAKENIIIARSGGRPTISFGGDVQRNTFIAMPKLNNGSQSALLSLSIPIFEGYFYENQAASAVESSAAAFAAWRAAELGVLLDVVTAYANYTTAAESIDFSEQYLKYSQEAYDATLENYKNGTGSFLDVLTAETTLSAARVQWVQARTQYLISIANIAYAVGTL